MPGFLYKKPLNPYGPGALSFGKSTTIESISSLEKGRQRSPRFCTSGIKLLRSNCISVGTVTLSLCLNSSQKGRLFFLMTSYHSSIRAKNLANAIFPVSFSDHSMKEFSAFIPKLDKSLGEHLFPIGLLHSK